VWEAKQLCPQIKIILARPERYIELHQQILEAIDTAIPVAAVHSIDECCCRLIGKECQPKEAKRIAKLVKEAIRDRIGPALRCSIGIAPNPYLAKVAADMMKPDGLTVIQKHELPEVMYSLKLDDFSGVGPAMLRRLIKAGIRTVEQLYAADEAQLRAIWNGLVGSRMYHLLHGEDIPMPLIKRRSVGHSYVLPPDARTPEGVRGVMVRLLSKAAARMRSMRLWTRRLELDVEIMKGQSWIAKRDVIPCQDTRSLLEAFEAIWQAPKGTPIRAGVTLGKCVHDAFMPAPLFDFEKRRLSLARAMDRINLRFGAHAVYYGGMHGAKDAAPLRISFTTIPDPSMPW